MPPPMIGIRPMDAFVEPRTDCGRAFGCGGRCATLSRLSLRERPLAGDLEGALAAGAGTHAGQMKPSSPADFAAPEVMLTSDTRVPHFSQKKIFISCTRVCSHGSDGDPVPAHMIP